MIYAILGFLAGTIPAAAAIVWSDRRAASHARIQRRVDQVPELPPGAYQPPARRALPAGPSPTVIEGEVG